jgi:probable addiction module antidote protein
MTRKLAPFDAAKYLTNRKAIAGYVTEALESGDAELVAIAIGDVARARGMTEIARKAGLSRENLYRALGAGTHPEFGTVLNTLAALGLQLTAKPAPRERRR